MNRVYVCSCFGITEKQVKEHAEAGACTPRQIASVSKAGTDCGSCVRRIQGILGRGACPRRELLEQGGGALSEETAPVGARAVSPVRLREAA
ncbi:(2Fe-2S)-binding protein [Streptomyces tirandamycinicus]|uniref:Bacterioferritin-associated ferredoxin n=1 Tax=Streptomyces tirandamycinicus TaxID=2174846 RepID=A0A2S1SNP1_9ACTN|nr:(2Fe-2S)-binding protein [Streptomyces tirandamycinicus]AWI28025.1 iron-sulfur binding protein [Streptomyces tirandamycinicus]MCY0984856.1 (2Fe-2S)-binding protein [Streptomyces tirandamycinicus]